MVNTNSHDRIASKHHRRNKRVGLIMTAIMLGQSANHAQLYFDRNGRGEPYCALKYYEHPDPLGPPVPRNLYLGRLEQWEVDCIRKAVADNAAKRAARKASSHQLHSLHDRIGMVRGLNRTAMLLARQAAKDSGFYLQGYELRKKRK